MDQTKTQPCSGCLEAPATRGSLCEACDDDLARHYDAVAAEEHLREDARQTSIDEQVRKGGSK